MRRASLLALSCVACSVGHGSGELNGTLRIAGCRREGAYSLQPDAFFAQTAERLLTMRVQRGGDIEVFSDGISVFVEDVNELKRNALGTEIDISQTDAMSVGLTAYFNETCPAERDKTPVALNAVAGSIRFDSVYAPQVDKSEVRIRATLSDVRFEDQLDPEGRWAVLSGSFDFLYVRGSPAQPFP